MGLDVSEIVCDVCGEPGVSEAVVQMGELENRLLLCMIHADPVRMLLNLTPRNRQRYANPGSEPLSRMWITTPPGLTPLDWMPTPAGH